MDPMYGEYRLLWIDKLRILILEARVTSRREILSIYAKETTSECIESKQTYCTTLGYEMYSLNHLHS